ncbi:uncharacterized protein LOC115675515 [Syzygium oleosum]|uniref:uncharacterized protein LOC115675515 n=1 Tax=Syzygium oleosum TaxID=219896 RepID=UPI0011D234F7|nr:uncharacterized protein LOC115675515 [Syzygium oleosum]
MGSYGGEDEDQYFDALEEASSVSDRSLNCSDCCSSGSGFDENVLDSLGFEFWAKFPESVRARRNRFLMSTGLVIEENSMDKDDTFPPSRNEIRVDTCRVTEDDGAVQRFSDSYNRISLIQSSTSTWSNREVESSGGGLLLSGFRGRSKESDDLMEFVVGGCVRSRGDMRLSEVGSVKTGSIEELRRIVASSPLVHPVLHRKLEYERELVETKQKMRTGWWRKFGSTACISGRHGDAWSDPDDLEITTGMKMRRVRAHSSRKKYKELSSLYAAQEFLAHEGSISTMKFSMDGQYLASAGEDTVVRVWKVTEEDRSEKVDIANVDSSCLYFSLNESTQLASLNTNKEHIGKAKTFGRSSDSSCVILPLKVFRITEKPWHEFKGHIGEVLDLSWSSEGYLLSSSTDKTVRLWRVGCDRCLMVYSHNDYVTSISFNPVNENFFISGSIDGKVRIWDVFGGQVVDYINSREIVSAVCYQSDGKGAIVGTMTGNCCFYSIEDNHLQMDVQVCLHGKKKSPGKRITGFQFPPNDPGKVMVTSADSVIRVLSGLDVICKLKGLRSSGGPMIATFTSDGKHVISASEDSNVHIWNYAGQDKTSSRVKNIWSCESFWSSNASVALPWCGIRTVPEALAPPSRGEESRASCAENGENHHRLEEYFQKMPPYSPDCFSLSRGFFLELLPKGSATWPEEKFSDSSQTMVSSQAISKMESKFLKSACHRVLSSHMWGLVIVTAGWDGRIRTYHSYGLPVRS